MARHGEVHARTSGGRRRGAGRAAIGLVAALLLAVPAVLPAGAEDTAAPVTESVTWAHPITDAVPRAAFGLGNISLMCIFAPEACPRDLADVYLALSDPMGTIVDPVAEPEPVQPAVPAGTVAVGLLAGNVRYQSALTFERPTPPDGAEWGDFRLVVEQAQPSYDVSSPATRAALNAALEVTDGDPEAVLAAFVAALAATPVESEVLGVRACPLTVDVESVEAPETASFRDIPRDEYGALLVACQYGAFGEYDPDTNLWSFDLTRAANAWDDGTLEEHGVFLAPVVTNYFGLGDEDPTTNAQVTLSLETASVSATSREVVAPPVVPPAVTPSAPEESGVDGQGAPPPVQAPAVVPPPVSAAPPVAPPASAPVTVPPPTVAPEGEVVSAPAPTTVPAASFALAETPEWQRWSALLFLMLAGTISFVLSSRRRKPVPVAIPASALADGTT